MKNSYTQKIKLIVAAVALCATGAAAQQVSDFEDLTLSPDSYNDGASGSGDFTSGQAIFNNDYNTTFGYWAGGFAYSNMGDTTTAPSDFMSQLYQTKAGAAQQGQNFGIGTLNSRIRFVAPTNRINGMYITNTTYAYNSMALGDSFGKKFGDSTSTHSAAGVNEGYPDWFKLSIVGYLMDSPLMDTVDFYLADFRFADNSQDYIVKNWQYVNLSSMGLVDSVDFILSSSDNGSFGMNTPAYFCIDSLVTQAIVTGINNPEEQPAFNVYPNPFENTTSLDFKNTNKRLINVYNAFGAIVFKSETSDAKAELNLESFDAGIYFVNVIEGGKFSTIRVIKK